MGNLTGLTEILFIRAFYFANKKVIDNEQIRINTKDKIGVGQPLLVVYGILGRWSTYIDTYYGGNIRLIVLLLNETERYNITDPVLRAEHVENGGSKTKISKRFIRTDAC